MFEKLQGQDCQGGGPPHLFTGGHGGHRGIRDLGLEPSPGVDWMVPGTDLERIRDVPSLRADSVAPCLSGVFGGANVRVREYVDAW